MPEYCFFLTHIFPYNDITYYSVLIQENRARKKPYSDVFHTVIILYISQVYEKQVYLLTDML